MCPEQLGGSAGGGFVAEQARSLGQAQEGHEDQYGVVVVDSAFVPLVVGGVRRLPDQGGQIGLRRRCWAVLVQQPGRKVLGAVDLGRLRGQGAVPVRAGGREVRVGHR